MPLDLTTWVYIACPYSHSDPSMRRARVTVATSYAAILMQQGRLAFSPITHGHPIATAGELPGSFHYWAALSEIALRASNSVHVLCLPGWSESVGVLWELDFAKDQSIPIQHVTIEEIKQYYANPTH